MNPAMRAFTRLAARFEASMSRRIESSLHEQPRVARFSPRLNTKPGKLRKEQAILPASLAGAHFQHADREVAEQSARGQGRLHQRRALSGEDAFHAKVGASRQHDVR